MRPAGAAEPRRILVTGSSGFVGRKLMQRLAGTDVVVLGLVGPDVAGDPKALDLTDAPATRAVVADFRPDLIVHLAALSSVGDAGARPDEVWRANFDGTRSVAEAARALGTHVRLVFASSGEVYGRQFNAGSCDETAPLVPLSAYARSKAACEYYLRDTAGGGFAVSVLRLFNHTGPGQDERFVVPSFAAQIAALAPSGGGEIQVGNLDAVRDFSDVDDVIDAYLAVIEAPAEDEAAFEVYNVGSGRPLSIRQVLDMLIARSGLDVTAVVDPARMRQSDVPTAAGRFDKVRDRFGWVAAIPFETTAAAVLGHEMARKAL